MGPIVGNRRIQEDGRTAVETEFVEDGLPADVQMIERIPRPQYLQIGVQHQDYIAGDVFEPALRRAHPFRHGENQVIAVGQAAGFVVDDRNRVVAYQCQLRVQAFDIGFQYQVPRQVDLTEPGIAKSGGEAVQLKRGAARPGGYGASTCCTEIGRYYRRRTGARAKPWRARLKGSLRGGIGRRMHGHRRCHRWQKPQCAGGKREPVVIRASRYIVAQLIRRIGAMP